MPLRYIPPQPRVSHSLISHCQRTSASTVAVVDVAVVQSPAPLPAHRGPFPCRDLYHPVPGYAHRHWCPSDPVAASSSAHLHVHVSLSRSTILFRAQGHVTTHTSAPWARIAAARMLGVCVRHALVWLQRMQVEMSTLRICTGFYTH